MYVKSARRVLNVTIAFRYSTDARYYKKWQGASTFPIKRPFQSSCPYVLCRRPAHRMVLCSLVDGMLRIFSKLVRRHSFLPQKMQCREI